MKSAMTDVEETPEPIGWFVTDPDGNVVQSGPITHAQAAFLVGETRAEAGNEGEQQ